MKVNVINVNKFIKENNLKEVKNPIYFNIGQVPTEDGLFSYDIFGTVGSEERKHNFAYINLNSYFLNPLVYKTLLKVDRKIENIVSGNKFYIINEKGELQEDNEKGETGLDFLYKNFKKIKFKTTKSNRRDDNLKFLNQMDIDELFMDKIIVIPAFLRDFNNKSNSTREVDEINDKYVKIIRIANNLSKDNTISLDFYNNNMKYILQMEIIKIYDYLIGKVEKKGGLFHQALLGKSVDYAVRSVISTQPVRSKKWNELSVKFGYSGIPLSQICVLFLPFMVKEISDFLDLYKDQICHVKDKKGNDIYIDNLKEQFTNDKIKKLIKNYFKSVEGRFDELYLYDKDGNKYPIELFKDKLGRNFTLIDLLYITATEVVKGKYVYITRYPIESYGSIYPSKIKLLSTKKVIPQMNLGDTILEDYPYVIPNYPTTDSLFVDTMQLNQLMTKSMGADFDGKILKNILF